MSTGKRRYRYVICDQDNTLVASERLWEEVDEAYYLQLLGPERWATWKPIMLKMRSDGIQMPEQFARLNTTFQFEHDPTALKEAREDVMFDIYRKSLKALPGANGLLHALYAADVTIAVASGMSRRIIETVREIMGWQDLYSQVASTHECGPGKSKPAPDVLWLAAERLGCRDPSQVLTIGNDAKDWQASVAAGMSCVIVPDSENSRAALPDDAVTRATLHEVLRDFFLQPAA